jgi:hypothetical protein
MIPMFSASARAPRRAPPSSAGTPPARRGFLWDSWWQFLGDLLGTIALVVLTWILLLFGLVFS